MAKPLAAEKLVEELRVTPGSRVRLTEKHAARTFGWERETADAARLENCERLGRLQYKQYADGRFALLVALQAMDGGGKDGTIRRVFTAFDPQGCHVASFKAPNSEELKHDYLWRAHHHTPRRGEVVVFNRSHYEDVLIVRVKKLVPQAQLNARYAQINDFERMLSENGTRVVKIFLHISRDEQRKRFEERLNRPDEHWKFNPADLEERRRWDSYQRAYEVALSRCSTGHAPWYAVPADRKWFRNFAVSQIVRQTLESLPLRFPEPSLNLSKIRIP